MGNISTKVSPKQLLQPNNSICHIWACSYNPQGLPVEYPFFPRYYIPAFSISKLQSKITPRYPFSYRKKCIKFYAYESNAKISESPLLNTASAGTNVLNCFSCSCRRHCYGHSVIDGLLFPSAVWPVWLYEMPIV